LICRDDFDAVLVDSAAGSTGSAAGFAFDDSSALEHNNNNNNNNGKGDAKR